MSYSVRLASESSPACRSCANISIESLTSSSGFHHEYVVEERYRNCRLCNEIAGRGGGSSVTNRTLKFRSVDVGFGKFCVGIEIVGEGNKDPDLIHRFLPLCTGEDDPAVELGVPPVKEWMITSSERAFQTAAHWIEKCNKSHDCLSRGPWLDEKWEPPARLIDFGDLSLMSSNVQIVEINQAAKTPTYSTLSYCWGTNVNSEYITVISNLEERKRSLSTASLPLTIRDAFEVSRRLNIRYMWVDAICIIQDSAEDWSVEAAKMGSIYARSYLTIAADSAKSATDGIFTQREQTNINFHRKTTSFSDGRRSTLYIPLQYHEGAPPRRDPNEEPLAQRGWVLQERMLSPRILHYNKQRIYWECRTCPVLDEECTLFCCETPQWQGIERYGLIRRLKLDETPERILAVWYLDLITNEYSKRKLTVVTDALPAVSGLAAVVNGYLRSEYLAGLWRDGLEWSLLWYKIRNENASKNNKTPRLLPLLPRSPLYVAPSWSWASVLGPVAWRLSIRFPGALPRFRIDKVETTLLGTDHYGRVTEGILEMTGFARDGQLRIRTGKYEFKDRTEWFGDIFMDYAEESGPVSIFLLFEPVGQTKFYMLVRPVGEGVLQYRRIGLLIHTSWKHELYVGERRSIIVV